MVVMVMMVVMVVMVMIMIDVDNNGGDECYEQVVCFLSPEPSLYGALMPRSTLGNNCALINPI